MLFRMPPVTQLSEITPCEVHLDISVPGDCVGGRCAHIEQPGSA